jgi:hypothetical protein
LVVRTFLQGLTPRSLAIRFPNGVHLAYDAQRCQLAYLWRGEFLDMGPVWTGRGGQPAQLGGPILWTSPDGFPWEVMPPGVENVPDFASR